MNKDMKDTEYLLFFAMVYIAIDLSSMVFAYKIIAIGPIIGAASSLIFPLTYSIMDVIAEVYGYKIAKRIIIYSFVCDLIFAFLVLIISHIPSLNILQTRAYMDVLGSLLRAVTAQMIGIISGAFINIYLISKWKMITNGKYFWLRSIGASAIGEGVMLMISVLIALTGVITQNQIILLIIYTYLYKILFAFLAAPFISILANVLKRKTHNLTTNMTNDFMSKLNNLDSLSSFQKL
jgi:uncharacterized integral membrane protein (TIGR00697 family)